MRILFDHSVFSLQTRGGISRYFVELVAGLQHGRDCLPTILAPLYVSHLLRDDPTLPVTGTYMPAVAGTHRLRQFVNNVASSLIIDRYDPEIIHSTYFLARVRSLPKIPHVITVFDMIHERFPALMPAGEESVSREKQRCMERAAKVICISENTRRDVVELAGIAPEKTRVIHLGCSFAERTDKGRTGPVCTPPYFLYVGNRNGAKNFHRLVRAFAGSDRLCREFRLLCFGGGPFTAEEQGQIGAAGLSPERLQQMTGDDALLSNLYSQATAMVYPSLYEGFGLPIVEAMASGCPVLCSNVSSMPEVAGDAALFFDPTRVEEMTACMEEIVDSAATRERLVKAGREQAAGFSWQRCVEQTKEVYLQCL